MTAGDLLLSDTGLVTASAEGMQQLSLEQIATLGLRQILKHHAFRYRDVCIRTPYLELMRKPLNKAILLRLMARRRCWVEDEQGLVRDISLWRLLLLGANRLHDEVQGRLAIRRFLGRVASLEQVSVRRPALGKGPAMYVRADLVFGIKSGGSVGHIAGVLNQLYALLGRVRFFTTEQIPTVDEAIETVVIRPGQRYADVPETRSLLFSQYMAERISGDWIDPAPRFIYQRYAVNNISGVLLAHRYQVPLVIEYNGSEVWINRHWGKALVDEAIALRLEHLNLRRADLVVVVSQPLADQIAEMGVSPDRILVNPNGVDPNRYRPDIDSRPTRDALGLSDRQVIGFIGTFGPWHGAEVLIEALKSLLDRRPMLRSDIVLLMIGDGQQMPAVKEAVRIMGLDDVVRFVGRIPQEDGPAHLAVCDILVSPHVPNPDGSAFFGSPTKLFEYMAMGRPIVASNLDQIGEILDDEETALLVPPADPEAIGRGIERLLDDPALADRLARNARQAVLRRHTWHQHTQRILARLDQILDGPDR